MRQTVSTVIEHTTKEELERRARDSGVPLSRYIRIVLEAHEKTAYATKEDKEAKLRSVLAEYDQQ